MPIKTSNYISEGKFYLQASCSLESAINMVNEVLEELKIDCKAYLKSKSKKAWQHIIIYLLFIVFVSSLWFLNNQCETIPLWLSTVIGTFLFLVSLVVMRLINHSFFDILLSRKKAEKKFEEEFYN